MNSTEKLLRALIDALGFEVEEVKSHESLVNLTHEEANLHYWTNNYPDCKVVVDDDGGIDIFSVTVDYKLTKKVKKVNISTHTGNKKQKAVSDITHTDDYVYMPDPRERFKVNNEKIYCSGFVGWDDMNNMEKASVLQKKINELTK